MSLTDQQLRERAERLRQTLQDYVHDFEHVPVAQGTDAIFRELVAVRDEAAK